MQGHYNIKEWDNTWSIVHVHDVPKNDPNYSIMKRRVYMRYNNGLIHMVNEQYMYDVLHASLCRDWQLNATSPQCWSPVYKAGCRY